jgi:hypothetical protein
MAGRKSNGLNGVFGFDSRRAPMRFDITGIGLPFGLSSEFALPKRLGKADHLVHRRLNRFVRT